ncbi:MAG: protein kinase, partial [Polyangiaceae bacterium]|nr:protein kinase [Polyangiaceae bacterium]
MSHSTELHQGRRFVVRREWRNGAARIKKSANAPASAEVVERLRHEHAVLQALHAPGIGRVSALEEGADGIALVLDDAGPADLGARVARGPLPVSEFLDLAIAMTRALGAVHERGFLHGDVCPENFVLDPEGGRVTLVDFELATEVEEGAARSPAEGLLDATLAYVAPERTGRMRVPVDGRADLYSLGATFYTMLTGAPPFDAPDPSGLVHAQVAKVPVPPADRDDAIPRLLSDLVLKLLAKMPELRYQTARAVV